MCIDICICTKTYIDPHCTQASACVSLVGCTHAPLSASHPLSLPFFKFWLENAAVQGRTLQLCEGAIGSRLNIKDKATFSRCCCLWKGLRVTVSPGLSDHAMGCGRRFSASCLLFLPEEPGCSSIPVCSPCHGGQGFGFASQTPYESLLFRGGELKPHTGTALILKARVNAAWRYGMNWHGALLFPGDHTPVLGLHWCLEQDGEGLGM